MIEMKLVCENCEVVFNPMVEFELWRYPALENALETVYGDEYGDGPILCGDCLGDKAIQEFGGPDKFLAALDKVTYTIHPNP
jgi:hypothetical protein